MTSDQDLIEYQRTALAMVRAIVHGDMEAFTSLGRSMDAGKLLAAMTALFAEFIEQARQGQSSDELLDAWALALASKAK